MNDPHVVALIYRIERGDLVDYDKAEPLVREEGAFRLVVKDKQAWFELKKDYATETDARKAIEEYIRVWEFDACLKRGPDFFRLEFVRAEMVDRSPTPGQVRLKGRLSIVGGGSARAGISVRRYPSPPSNLNLNPRDPNTDTMFQRYMGYFQQREPLQYFGQF